MYIIHTYIHMQCKFVCISIRKCTCICICMHVFMYMYTGGRTGETEERGPRGARPPAGLLALLVQNYNS